MVFLKNARPFRIRVNMERLGFFMRGAAQGRSRLAATAAPRARRVPLLELKRRGGAGKKKIVQNGKKKGKDFRHFFVGNPVDTAPHL